MKDKYKERLKEEQNDNELITFLTKNGFEQLAIAIEKTKKIIRRDIDLKENK